MAQRAIPRPFNPFIPELMNPTPIGMQPGLMQPQPQPVPGGLAGAPRRVPTTVEPGMQAMGASAQPASAMPMPQGQPGGGFMSGIQDFLGSDASLAMAAGLLGGGPTSQAVGRGFGNAFQARQKPTGRELPEAYQIWELAGKPGSFAEWYDRQKLAGAQKTYGAPQPGFRYEYDEQGNPVQAIPIPGTEAAMEAEAEAAKQSEQQGQAEVSTSVITTAAQRARDAAKARWTGAVGQPIAGLNPLTASAEAARQVEVLKAQAKAENLTSMRQASPTGAAMGNVSNADIQLLADKSGALDPSSPNFERDVDDYELTLLQVIHGPRVGKAIFDQTRHQDRPDVPADVTPEEWDAMSEEDKQLWSR